ncbi:hypothetical protein HGM15179_020460 [Zosterops borbonicus]|uniref:Uncharacterized protein n=1 Tax=Zosterops borbonicus TaxID=364589 RepID=A0A8K1D9P3_9PASS|nr:hypothetical protein HGM15179_020460 [Zosterops borbonicus]
MQWLNDKPVWENQWPLPQDKLVAFRDLVQEQLDQGHLDPSTSPWNCAWFWDNVHTKANAVGGRGSAQCPLQGRDGFPSSAAVARHALAPVPMEHMGQDSEDDDVSPASLKAFAVVKDAGRKKHAHLLLQALIDLRDRVVEYDMFESKWTQLAETAAAQNQMARQDDPRYGVGPDMLLGIGDFVDVNKQIAYEPLVLEQCQRTGMAALIQTMEMSAPKQSFATIFQGTDEPFLRFTERLTASVE